MVETIRTAYRLQDVTFFQITPVALRRYIHNDDQWLLSQPEEEQHTPSGILDLFIDSIEADDFPGSYNYFHHAGGHPSIQFDEHCQFIGTQKWNYENTRAQVSCFLLQLERLVRKLKEQDLYDQTLILVNGDHGSQWVSPLVKSRTGSIVQTQIITSANPLLFVKPRETRGSLRFSNAPVSIGDIPATVNRAFGLDGDFPGIPIFDISESDERERIYLWYKPRPEVFMEQKLPRTMPYRILGNLFNQYDWIPPCLSDLEKAPSVLPMDHENLHEFAQGFSCRRPKLQHNPISGNIPLAEAIAWMVGLASRGMIEFLRRRIPWSRNYTGFGKTCSRITHKKTFFENFKHLHPSNGEKPVHPPGVCW